MDETIQDWAHLVLPGDEPVAEEKWLVRPGETFSGMEAVSQPFWRVPKGSVKRSQFSVFKCVVCGNLTARRLAIRRNYPNCQYCVNRKCTLASNGNKTDAASVDVTNPRRHSVVTNGAWIIVTRLAKSECSYATDAITCLVNAEKIRKYLSPP